MKINKIAFLTSTCLLFAMPSSANGYEDQVRDPAGKTLAEAMAAIQSANGNAEQRNANLYKAFEAAFQMGDYGLAMQTLGGAVANGYALNLWDQAALAEMFARQGKYDLAKERINFAIDGFKGGKCDVNSKWKDFSEALAANNISEVKAMISGAQPALINTYPSTNAERINGFVTFTSYDEKYPKEIPVTLVIDNKGKVACSALEPEYQQYSSMLNALRNKKFKAARVNGEKVWQYGYIFTIKHEVGNPGVERAMSRGGRGSEEARFPSVEPDP